jgi:DNA-binding NarL/FixJ family response regulator
VTPRQRQILQMFADGHSTDEAAKRLGLSAETVRTHAKATLPRLGARDRAHAIAIALRSSLID